MVADLLLILRTSVHDHLRHHASEEEPEEGEGEAEAGPVVTVLHDLEAVTVELDIAVEVHLVESLHGNPVLAAVLELVALVLECKVVLDGGTRVASLLVDTGRHGRGDGPERHEDGNGEDEGEDEPCPEATVQLPCAPCRDTSQEREEDDIVEALSTSSVGGEGSVLDSRVLLLKEVRSV